MPLRATQTLGCWASILTLTVRLMNVKLTVAVAKNVRVRNWQRTQSCAQWLAAVMCPWQVWCTQSAHSVTTVEVLSSSCTWSDEKISIGKKTANSNQAAIYLLVFSFTAAKLLITAITSSLFYLKITFFKHNGEKWRKINQPPRFHNVVAVSIATNIQS